MMFKTRTAANATLDKRLAELEATNDTWHDGTIESVDRRIAQVSQARHAARGLLDDPELSVTLEASVKELRAFRTALLNDSHEEALPERLASTDMYRALPTHIRHELAVTSHSFLASNMDAARDLGELAIRSGYEGRKVAERLVQTEDARALVREAFVDAVQRRAIALPAELPKREAAVDISFDDDMLFA